MDLLLLLFNLKNKKRFLNITYLLVLLQGCEESVKQFEQRKRKGTDPDNTKYFYIKDIQVN